jgi:hypothetical protein
MSGDDDNSGKIKLDYVPTSLPAQGAATNDNDDSGVDSLKPPPANDNNEGDE